MGATEELEYDESMISLAGSRLGRGLYVTRRYG